MKRLISTLAVLVLLGALGWAIAQRLDADAAAARPAGNGSAAVPVELAPVERGAITLRRTLSGTLEAAAEFVVAPKIGGRLERVEVDLGDAVERGQVVAVLDDDELEQELRSAEADLAVAVAGVAEARSALEIAERGLARVNQLFEEGATSEAQLDAARSDELAARAQVEVNAARNARAEAALETARIRLGYARVTADWSGEDPGRVVAARRFDEGETVPVNEALLTIVQLDPVVAVVHIPERDYGRLGVGQPATLVTDAWPGRSFAGEVSRIAPVFRQTTRQARVELRVPNPDGALKPGMFVRATLELEHVEDATIVPFAALAERGGQEGVFVLEEDGAHVRWLTVTSGVREGERLELVGAALTGAVVTLGQELCDDGALVTVPEAGEPGGR